MSHKSTVSKAASNRPPNIALQPTSKTNSNSRSTYLDAVQSRPKKSSPRLSVRCGTNTKLKSPPNSVSRPRTNTDSRSPSRSGSRPQSERQIVPSTASSYSGRCSYCNEGTHGKWRYCTNCRHRLDSTSNESSATSNESKVFDGPRPVKKRRRGESEADATTHPRDPSLSPLAPMSNASQLIGAYASVEFPEDIIEETVHKIGPTSYSDPVLSRQHGLTHNEQRQVTAYIKRARRKPTDRRRYLQHTLPNFLPIDRHTAPLPSIKSAGNSPGYPPSLPSIPEHSNTNSYPCTQSAVVQKQEHVAPASTLSEQHANRVETASWHESTSSNAPNSEHSSSTDAYQRHINLIEANIDRIRAMPITPSSQNNLSSQSHPPRSRDSNESYPVPRVAAHSQSADSSSASVADPPSTAVPPNIFVDAGVALRCPDDDSDVDLDLELDSDDDTESSSSQGLEAKPIPDSYWFDTLDRPDYGSTITSTVPSWRDIDLYDNAACSSNASDVQIPPLPPAAQLASPPNDSRLSIPPSLNQFALGQPRIDRTIQASPTRVRLPSISEASSLPIPPLPSLPYVDHSAGASQPLRACVAPSLSVEDQFTEKIRRDGVFGDPVNMTELNSVMYYMLNQVSHNAFGFKKWVSGRETNRSLAESCKYGNRHRKCVQKHNHLSGVHEKCGDTHRAWLADPSTQKDAKLFQQNGNNERLIAHVRRFHPDTLRRARNLLLFYLQDQDMRCTIPTILAPLRKTERGNRRKLKIRGGFNENADNVVPLPSTVATANKHRLRQSAKAEILAFWSESTIQIVSSGFRYASQCRRGFSPINPAACSLKKDGSEPRRKAILQWNRIRYCALQRYKCTAHPEMRRMSVDHSDIFVVAPDKLTLGLLRIGSTLLTPSWALSAVKLYVKSQQSVESVRSAVIENWVRTYRDTARTTHSEEILHAVFDQLCPAMNTMRIIIRTLLLVIYVRIKFDLTQLLFERTPLGFGEDQTWNRTAKIIATNGETQQMGLHTVTDTLGCLLRYGFLNNHSEDHYQKVCLLTDVKALQLLYGNLETLKHCVTVWGSDNIKSNVNLPAKIKAELLKQLESNPKYELLKQKLADNDVKISDLVDVADECQLHKFRRTYKALKDDGLGPKKHADFEIATQGEIWIINSIQYGGTTISESIPYCGTSSRADGKWLDVFEFEWEHKEYLAVSSNDDAICELLHEYLQIDGINAVETRNTRLAQFKSSQKWIDHHHILQSWATSVHPFYRGQTLGRWINASKAPNPHWIHQCKHFVDGEDNFIKVTQDHVNQYIVDIILRLFRVNIAEYKYAPMLLPTDAFLQWLYDGLLSPLHHKVRESTSHEHTKPIMQYEHTAKQLQLAIKDISVSGAANSRQDDLEGVWKNVNNERFHHTNRTQKRKVAPNQRVEFAVIELDVELVEFNVDKLTHLVSDRPELFDDEFIGKFNAIKTRLADPEALKDVTEQRYCLNLSDVLEDHIKACNQMITIRDISYKHKKFLTKQNRYNLARDLYVFRNQIQTISIDSLGTFAVTYNVSIIPIIKEMQRAGLIADKFENGVSITAPESIPRVRQMIDNGQFKRITLSLDTSLNLDQPPSTDTEIAPMPIEFASAIRSPNEPYPLPSIEPSAHHEFDQDSANIGDYNISLLPAFKTLISIFRNYNEFNHAHRVQLNLVHAINMAQYTLQDFIHALFEKQRINVVYNNIFTESQVAAIHSWAMKPGFKSLLLALLESTSKKINHLSYQRRHATVSNPQCVAMNVLGNDATKNAKYSTAKKKRRVTDIGADDETAPPKKKQRQLDQNRNQRQEWRQIFRINSNENRLKAKLKQCECKYEEVHLAKVTAAAKKFKSWESPDACLRDIGQQTVSSLKRGGAVRLKHFASLHGWKKDTPFGNVKEYAMDFVVMHCVYGLTADAFHAMKRVDIINHYQQHWASKKPDNGQW